MREDVLRFARFGSILRSVTTSYTRSVVGWPCIDFCHDSTDRTASGFVAGFVEPIVKELPLEYAIEMNRLIQIQMEGSVG